MWTPEKSALYRPTLKVLVAAQIVRRLEDGGHELIQRPEYAQGVARSDSRAEHPSVPPPPVRESMATLTSRVPPSQIEGLDRIAAEQGVSRSDVLREILETALKAPAPVASGSGTRPRVAPPQRRAAS
jgi:hypothetical protein